MRKWTVFLLVFTFSILVFITAWLSDDAYITFRCVDNFVNGYGLRWNIDERVQAFTHPLWMFLISIFHLVTNEFYFTSLALSIILSLTAYFLLVKNLSSTIFSSIAAGIILVFSKSYVDYSTSGLENPLTHFLIVLLLIFYFKQINAENKILILSFLAALIALCRLDLLLMVLPVLGSVFFGAAEKKRQLFRIFFGFTPLFLWEIFSIFYYGSFLPNTAYAKLNTGINRSELIEQGFYYLQDSLYQDPLTFFTIIVGTIIPFIYKKRELWWLAAGTILYIVYIINIGGDFMSGRFLAAPLLFSVIIISKFEIHSLKQTTTLVLLIILVGLLSPKPNIFSTAHYSFGPKIIHAFRFGPQIMGMHNGITDERFWYYENTGLLNNLFERKIEQHPWVRHALAFKKSGNSTVVKSTLGLFGFYCGRNIHIIDQYALTEPLLARLPISGYWITDKNKPAGEKSWRIGHFPRKIPEGYLETITSGENRINNPSLAEYYNKISIIVKGKLLDLSRLKVIWNLNIGKYNCLLEQYNNSSLR